MARISSRPLALLEDATLFDADSAIAYAGLSTNANDEVGVSYMLGGGTVHPSHVVGVLSAREENRRSLIVATGERSPRANGDGHFEWGDYLTVRPIFPARTLFAGAGLTLKGNVDGDNQDATPDFVVFGRISDIGAPGGGGGGGDEGGGGPEDGAGGVVVPAADEPIRDVNQLPTVSPEVARQIKAACAVHSRGPRDFLEPEALPLPQLVTKPGVERWPVKTGQDPDLHLVGKNIINGVSLGL